MPLESLGKQHIPNITQAEFYQQLYLMATAAPPLIAVTVLLPVLLRGVREPGIVTNPPIIILQVTGRGQY